MGTAVELQPINDDDEGYAYSSALALSASGTTVGESAKYSNDGTAWLGSRATKWSGNATSPIPLGLFNDSLNAAGHGSGAALNINDAGTAVGYLESYLGSTYRGTRAVRWNDDGSYTKLNGIGTTPAGETTGKAKFINDAGVTIGQVSKYADGDFKGHRAVRWANNAAAVTELGVLGGTNIDGVSYSDVYGMNEAGLIVGYSRKHLLSVQIGTRAVYWNQSGAATATELPNLGTSDGITNGEALAVNDSNVIVGRMERWLNNGDTFGGSRAVMWTTDGTDAIVDLNTLVVGTGWTLEKAQGLTDTGFISGIGTYDPDKNGPAAAHTRAFSILVPQAGTYGKGDATFDTAVNFDDLLVLAKHYGTDSNQAHNRADFDLDGTTDFDDLLTLAKHYNLGVQPAVLTDGTLSGAFQAEFVLAQSLVPEPATA